MLAILVDLVKAANERSSQVMYFPAYWGDRVDSTINSSQTSALPDGMCFNLSFSLLATRLLHDKVLWRQNIQDIGDNWLTVSQPQRLPQSGLIAPELLFINSGCGQKHKVEATPDRHPNTRNPAAVNHRPSVHH